MGRKPLIAILVDKYRSEYLIWHLVKRRCMDSSNSSYRNYGARGVKICERWLKFEDFITDVGLRPSSKYTLERIDNDGNYEPGNVRWATRAEQSRNKRNNRHLVYMGTDKLLIEWAEEYNLSRLTLSKRLKRGWPVELALKTPLKRGPYFRSAEEVLL